jgi:BAI1-associated protein 3
LTYNHILYFSIKDFKYAHHLLQVYDSGLDEEIQPFTTVVCGNLTPINTSVTDESEVDRLVGKSIFKLFMELRKFLNLGLKVSDNGDALKLKNCHIWFSTAVQHWLDASIYKAKLRIAKAIELDTLQPLDDINRNSTSAVDMVSIFYQVFKFWEDLEWPDASSGFTFVRKIIEDICDCCNLYMEKMTQCATGMQRSDNNDSSRKFEVTKEWCCAINNLDYMRNNLEKMVLDFRVDLIVARLPESYQSESLGHLNTIIANALEKQRLNIAAFIDEITERMAPNLELDLLDGAAHLHNDPKSLDKMMAYLDDSLKMLNAELSAGNFERIMDKMWLEICRILEKKTMVTSVGDICSICRFF